MSTLMLLKMRDAAICPQSAQSCGLHLLVVVVVVVVSVVLLLVEVAEVSSLAVLVLA